MEKNFPKIQNFKFYPKNTRTGVKKIDHHSINSRNYAAACYQTLEEVPGPVVPEKTQKHEKKQIFLKIA